jgi:geranylgeranyl pyrophosphate synthase
MNKSREAKSSQDVDYVLAMIDKYDAVGFARKRANELMKRAIATLKGIQWMGDHEAAEALAAFSRFAVEREW